VAFGHAVLLASLGEEVQALLRGRIAAGAAAAHARGRGDARRGARGGAAVLPGFRRRQWLWMVTINGALGQWIARRAGIAGGPRRAWPTSSCRHG
jgi:hypothetical protein